MFPSKIVIIGQPFAFQPLNGVLRPFVANFSTSIACSLFKSMIVKSADATYFNFSIW